MSSLSRVEVFKIDRIEKHPNADMLELVYPFGFVSCVKSGQYKEGDLACFVPPDMVVDLSLPEFDFLPKARIRSIKLRGFQSFGLVVPARPHFQLGQDVTKELNCCVYEPPLDTSFKSIAVQAPPGAIKYTDIDSLRRYEDVFLPEEPVVITEKIHGCHLRAMHNGEFHIGSNNQWVQHDNKNIWSRMATILCLEEILKPYPNKILFGEVYGWVQDLRYGHQQGQYSFRAFDMFDLESGKFYDWDKLVVVCNKAWIEHVPILYSGPWKGIDQHRCLAEENSCLCKEHIREGIVVKPQTERFSEQIGRVILKLHSDNFIGRK